MLPEVLYLARHFSYSSVRSKKHSICFSCSATNGIVINLFTQIQNMTVSTFYSNEDSRLPANMNANIDDRDDDDDFDDETLDQPLNRSKTNFVPARDPLVAALFGPAVQAHGENAAEPECGVAV